MEDVATPLIGTEAYSSREAGPLASRLLADLVHGRPAAIADDIALEALSLLHARYRETILVVGPLELDRIDRTARRVSRTIVLLPREFQLLEYMMRHHDEIVSRANLFRDVWNYQFVPDSTLSTFRSADCGERSMDQTKRP